MRARLSFLLTLAVLVALPAALPGQRIRLDRIRRAFDRHYDVEIGVIGGPNRNTVTGAGAVDAKFRGSLGGYLSVPVVGDLRIRPEVSVSGKQVGWARSPAGCLPGECPTGAGAEVASFTWLEVPVLLETRFHGLREVGSPRLYAGPFVAVRLSCSFAAPVSQGAPSVTNPEARVVTPCVEATPGATRYSNGDGGLVLGAGVSLGPIGLGLRWTRSLVPIAPEQSAADGRPFVGAKHSTLALLLELGTRIR